MHWFMRLRVISCLSLCICLHSLFIILTCFLILLQVLARAFDIHCAWLCVMSHSGQTTGQSLRCTMREALEQAREAMWNYHHTIGFPVELTEHAGGGITQRLSLDPELASYDGYGNWTGSVVMYYCMFCVDDDESILRIFDQTGCRRDVYEYWGGRTQDVARTNLLESMLAIMGRQEGIRVQRAWLLMAIYAHRAPNLTGPEILREALLDPARDLWTDHDELVYQAMKTLGHETLDITFLMDVKKLLPHCRNNAAPDYWTICSVTGCSNKGDRRQRIWGVCNKLVEHFA